MLASRPYSWSSRWCEEAVKTLQGLSKGSLLGTSLTVHTVHALNQKRFSDVSSLTILSQEWTFWSTCFVKDEKRSLNYGWHLKATKLWLMKLTKSWWWKASQWCDLFSEEASLFFCSPCVHKARQWWAFFIQIQKLKVVTGWGVGKK